MYQDSYHKYERERKMKWREKNKKLCPLCKQRYYFPGAKLCISCANKRSGSNNPQWKGGRVKRGHKSGYIAIFDDTHPYKDCDNYVLEHRLVMERHIGRVLLPIEVVHHINGNKTDNRIENLMLFSNQSEHVKYHQSLEK